MNQDHRNCESRDNINNYSRMWWQVIIITWLAFKIYRGFERQTFVINAVFLGYFATRWEDSGFGCKMWRANLSSYFYTTLYRPLIPCFCQHYSLMCKLVELVSTRKNSKKCSSVRQTWTQVCVKFFTFLRTRNFVFVLWETKFLVLVLLTDSLKNKLVEIIVLFPLFVLSTYNIKMKEGH